MDIFYAIFFGLTHIHQIQRFKKYPLVAKTLFLCKRKAQTDIHVRNICYCKFTKISRYEKPFILSLACLMFNGVNNYMQTLNQQMLVYHSNGHSEHTVVRLKGEESGYVFFLMRVRNQRV